LNASPAWIEPNTIDIPARASTRRPKQRRHLGDDATERADQIGGQVWAGRVAAAAGQAHLDRVAGRGEGARAYGHHADRELRRAVQRENRADVLERTGVDHLHGAGVERLLRRLEDQADPAGQFALRRELRQRHADPEKDRRVDIVATSMGHAVDGRPVGHVLDVHQRQRVHVGAKRNHAVALADVANQAVAALDELGLQPGGREQLCHVGSRLELMVGKLGVHVKVTAYSDEIRVAREQPAIEVAGHGWDERI
jgi:hypothetical protein